jgi:hypothetical protein
VIGALNGEACNKNTACDNRKRAWIKKMYEIQVDYRERLLLSHLSKSVHPNLRFVSSPLEVGDVLGPNFVIERKTRSDFLSSLKDGRLKTQRDRMRELPERVIHCRVVLIERESVCKLHDDPCMISLFAKDCVNNRGMTSLSVCCVQNTCHFIVKLAQLLLSLGANPNPPTSVGADALMYLTPRAHCRTLLKRTVGDDDVDIGSHRGLLGFLLSLERVGRAKALAVTHEYGSIKNLVGSLTDDRGGSEIGLTNLSIAATDGTGKKRRRMVCGPATCQTILNGLGFEGVVLVGKEAGRPHPDCITDVNIDPEDGSQNADKNAGLEDGMDGNVLPSL